MGYIRFPIDTDPETLVAEFISFVRGYYPDYAASDANLDMIIARFFAFKAGEIRDLASDVQDDIFRFYGATLVGLQPTDATEASGTTTWTLVDTLGHTIPAGTAVSLQTAEGIAIPFVTVSDVIVPVGSNNATGVLIQALQPGSVASNLTGPVTLIDVKDWISSVVLVGTTSGGVDAETDADYLDRLTRHLQRLSTRPILAADFASAAFDAVPAVDRALAIDGYNPIHNFLTANQSSMETDASGWTNQTNATLASSTAQAADGSKSIAVTAVAGGTTTVQTPAVTPPAAGSIAASPTDTITGLCSFRAATTGRSVHVALEFLNSSGTQISLIDGASVSDTNGGWVQASLTIVAPAGTAYVRLRAIISSAAAAEVHYIDKAAIRRGANTTWVIGGTAETGQEKMVAVSAVDSDGNALSTPDKAALVSYLQSQREVNFVVNYLDPLITMIDVNTQFKVLPGYDPATAVSNVTTALQNYLSPKNWGVDPNDVHHWIESPTVYYNEVVALISNVVGVDRVTSLLLSVGGLTPTTPAAADVGISHPAGLVDYGTLTVTAV